MIHTIAMISGPLSLMVAFLGVVWLMRCKQCIFFRGGLVPIAVLVYAIWHFIAHSSVEPDSHLIVHNLFTIFTSAIVAIQCNLSNLRLTINRRNNKQPIKFKDRRKND